MDAELIRGLYDYHRWANHRLFDVAAGLGEEPAQREVGKQFSWVWLMRWKGTSPTKLPGGEIESLADLREKWDAVEREQRAFVESLTPADLGRIVAYTSTEGKAFKVALGPLLQHVVNHATHHRSEIATMLTMIHGSPPPTDLAIHQLIQSGQMS